MSDTGESKPLAENEDDRKPDSCCARLRSVVTVEPIAFFYILGAILANSTNQQYASYYNAEQMGGDPSLLSISICDLTNENNTEFVQEVQTAAAEYMTVFTLINSLPMLLTALLMGSYSDNHGRKVAMVLPVMGGMIRAAISLGVQYTGVNIQWMYVGAGIEGIFGGTAVMSVALFAYIADISDAKNRSWRMILLSVAEAVGISISEIGAGYLITYCGFEYPYIIVLVVYTLCLFLIFYYLRETVTSQLSIRFFSCSHLGRTFQLLFRKAHGWTCVLWLTSISLLFIMIASSVSSSALFLYVLQQLCFSWVQVGYLIGLVAVTHSIGGPAAYRFFNTFYPDAAVLGIAALDGVIARVYLAIPVLSSTYVYFESLVSFMVSATIPISRSLMSQMVGPDEQGAVQALAAIISTFGAMIGSVTANTVYVAALATYSGAPFVVSAALYFVVVLMAVLMNNRIKNLTA